MTRSAGQQTAVSVASWLHHDSSVHRDQFLSVNLGFEYSRGLRIPRPSLDGLDGVCEPRADGLAGPERTHLNL